MGAMRGVLAGGAAGSAGTTALNAVTYLDMAVRGRPASETPQQAVQDLADRAGVGVPGDGQVRDARLQGLGPLMGVMTGVGVGVVLGLARRLGWRPPLAADVLAATALALVSANAPMAGLGISDPRTWSKADWASDLVPHVAYGVVTAATLHAVDSDR
jgi:hypothetical protein